MRVKMNKQMNEQWVENKKHIFDRPFKVQFTYRKLIWQVVLFISRVIGIEKNERNFVLEWAWRRANYAKFRKYLSPYCGYTAYDLSEGHYCIGYAIAYDDDNSKESLRLHCSGCEYVLPQFSSN